MSPSVVSPLVNGPFRSGKTRRSWDSIHVSGGGVHPTRRPARWVGSHGRMASAAGHGAMAAATPRRGSAGVSPALPILFVVRDVPAEDDVPPPDPHALLVPGQVHHPRAAATFHPVPLLARHERVVAEDIFIDRVFIAP